MNVEIVCVFFHSIECDCFFWACLFLSSGQKCNQNSYKELGATKTTGIKWYLKIQLKKADAKNSGGADCISANYTNQFANVAKSFSTPFSRILWTFRAHEVWVCDYSTDRYTINSLCSTNAASTNENVNIIMAKDISFWEGRQWNFSTPTCMTWMWMRLILSTLNGAFAGHTRTLQRMNITFLPYPRTHRLMKRNGCGVGVYCVLPLWHIIQMSWLSLFVCLAAWNISHWPRPKS